MTEREPTTVGNTGEKTMKRNDVTALKEENKSIILYTGVEARR